MAAMDMYKRLEAVVAVGFVLLLIAGLAELLAYMFLQPFFLVFGVVAALFVGMCLLLILFFRSRKKS